MTNFFELGVSCGKLACEYQPAPLGLPAELSEANEAEQQFFWTGYKLGWDKQEASNIVFCKVDRLLSTNGVEA